MSGSNGKRPMLSRRVFSSSVLALAALPLTGARAAARTNTGALDLNNPADLVTAVMKMRSSTDGSLRFGWLKAKRAAYIDGEITPLLDLLAGTVSRAVPTGEGTYDITVLETTYYLDSNSGELLEDLEMPGTGRVVAVPLYRSAPKTIAVASQTETAEVSTGDAGVVEKDSASGRGQFAPRGDVRLERSVGPAFVEDDTVWIRTHEYGRVAPHDPAQSAIFYRESATWQGRLTELVDPDVNSAWTALAYSAASSWRPWMQMGPVKGHTMSDGIGGKVHQISDMPAEWLRLTEQHHPDIMENPGQALSG